MRRRKPAHIVIVILALAAGGAAIHPHASGDVGGTTAEVRPPQPAASERQCPACARAHVSSLAAHDLSGGAPLRIGSVTLPLLVIVERTEARGDDGSRAPPHHA